MSKNALEILFESKTKIKLLKFVFQNDAMDFTIRELAVRIQEPYEKVEQELARFLDIGLITIKE